MPGPVLSERDLAVLRSFARRIDPSDAGAHNNLGVLYYQKGLIEDAIAEFVRALELDPRDAGRAEQPRHRLPRERPLRPPDHRAPRAGPPPPRGPRRPLGAGPRPRGARAATPTPSPSSRRCSPGSPSDVPAMLQLGLAEKARGNLDTATDWLSRACAQDPASAVARFYYGEVLYNRGLNEPALEALREAIARNPEYAEAHYLLAFVYGDIGRARGGPRGHQARHQAEPDAGACAGQPRARALRRRGRRSGTVGAARRASADRRGRRARALQPRARASGRRACTRRRCASTAWRSTPARTAG